MNVRIAVRLALVCILVTGAGNGVVSASVRTPTLDGLALGARAMAVARVERVDRIAGCKVARAVVVRPIAGLQMGQQFAFLADPTWDCDISSAVEGETVLLFLAWRDSLASWPFSGERKWLAFDTQRRAELRGVPFFHIYWSGYGRVPIEVHDGGWFVGAANLGFSGKTGVPPSIRGMHRNEPDGSYLLRLSDVEDYLGRFQKVAIPSSPPEVSKPPMCTPHPPDSEEPPLHWGHQALLVIFSVLGAAFGALAVSVRVYARLAHRPVCEMAEGTRQ